MTEEDFIKEVETATTEERLKWEKLNPDEFNPPCSYRTDVNVGGKRYALNVHDGVMKVFDDVGLVTETKADFSLVQSAIDAACKTREPEAVFEAVVKAVAPTAEPKA
jgi:hypothetical protein